MYLFLCGGIDGELYTCSAWVHSRKHFLKGYPKNFMSIPIVLHPLEHVLNPFFYFSNSDR